MLTLLLANFFDLLGTMVGVSNAGGIQDAAGEIPYSRRIMFLATIVLASLAAVIPVEAASATLVLVGFLMMQQIVRIDWTDLEIAIPAFMTLVIMPFSYSITNGIGAGFVTYVVIKVLRGKWREVHALMHITAGLFVVYFVSGPIQDALGVS